MIGQASFVVEVLELRRLPSVTAAWKSDESVLSIASTSAGDQISVSVDGSQKVVVSSSGVGVTITSAPPGGLASSAVRQLFVDAQGGDDTIDLTGLTTANGFSAASLDYNVIVSGGDGNDTITGGDFADVLNGDGGADTLTGGLGNDVIGGGDGNDTISGGGGDDRLAGGAGDDSIDGGGNDDQLRGDGFSAATAVGLLASPTGETLDEASGLIVSRGNTDILWSIEDSGNSRRLIANDATNGNSRGSYSLSVSTSSADWEDMTFFSDGTTNWIYIGEIGDNNNNLATVTIYRLVEPTGIPAGTGTHATIGAASIDRIVLQYPNDAQGGGASSRSRDAETLMADPLTGDIYIVSKREVARGVSHLYRLPAASANWTPANQAAPATQTLTDEGALKFPAPGSVNSNFSPSGGDISADGMQVLLKSDRTIHQYVRTSAAQSLTSLLTTTTPVQVPAVLETGNRESIAWNLAGTAFFTTSEFDVGGAQQVLRYDTATGNDSLKGGDGNDTIDGGGGSDAAYGGDTAGAGTGNDTFYGGAGDDFYFADGGDDSLYGGAGNDDYYVAWNGGSGAKVVNENASEGSDRVVLSGVSQGVTFDLALTTAQTLSTGFTVRLGNQDTVENVAGTGYADTLYGNAQANSIDGGGTASAGGGYDTLYGRDGDDVLWTNTSWLNTDNGIIAYGDAGNDTIHGGLGFDRMYGGDGDDVLDGYSNTDAGYGGDAAGAGTGNDTFYGGLGDDYYFADGGDDTLYGGDGNDDYYVAWNGGSGAKVIYENASEGSDRVVLAGMTQGVSFDLALTTAQTLKSGFTVRLGNQDTVENVYGTGYVDTLYGNGQANNLDGAGTASAGGGYDVLYGRDGNDVLTTSTSWLNTNNGIIAYGEGGNDSIYGGLGFDRMYGGDGNDVLDGYSNNDVGYGGDAGGAGTGNDTFYGDDGDDVYFADGGDDSLYGGPGNDDYYVAWNGGSGAKVIYENANEGADRIRFTGMTQGVSFSLASTSTQTIKTGFTVRIANLNTVENLSGTQYADTLFGNSVANDVDGAGSSNANDTIYGGDGNDTIWTSTSSLGGFGITAYGEAGNDTIIGGLGVDVIYGGLGNDTIYGGASNDTLYGDDANTSPYGGGADTIYGGDGNDTMYGGYGGDTMYGDAGNDVMYGDYTAYSYGGGADTMYGGDGADTMYGGYGGDAMYGNAGNDLMYGDDPANPSYGGDDSMYGGDGDDTMYGGYGGDTLYGGTGTDLLVGGAGTDTGVGGDGTDTQGDAFEFWTQDGSNGPP